MAPTTSDASDGDGRPPVSPADEFRVEQRTIQGRTALVHRHPDRVFVEWQAGQPATFGVRVGDRLKDADADVSSPGIDEWTVTEISPDRLVGEHVRTGERREFDRERVERGLVVGNYATNLTTFVRVATHAVGRPADEVVGDGADDAGHGVIEGADATDRGRPHVTVVAYGDNGRKYGLRYRYVGGGDGERLTPWDESPPTRALDADRRAELFAAVEAALRADGYRLD
jgi:hypothetical protein